MKNNGCSTCLPGQEKWEEYYSELLGKTRVEYEYRTLQGRLFACNSATLEEARQQRDIWLSRIQKPTLLAPDNFQESDI